MKRIFALLLLLGCWAGSFAQDLPARPQPPKLVNDFIGILSPDQAHDLEQKVVAYDDSTSSQIAIVIVSSVNGNDMNDYATKLGRAWGIGSKDFNNGVLILVAKDDHKVYVATGYGLEGALPDITCKAIVDNEILPNFRANDFYQGLSRGVDAIIKAAAGEYKAPAGYNKKSFSAKKGIGVVALIIIIIVFISIISGGRGGGGYMSRRGYWGGPVFWGGFGAGSSSGSSWGGGGSSGGGGFGGFGGGSFGGGGSGGSW